MAGDRGQIAPEKINGRDQSVKSLSYCSLFNQNRKKISFEVQLSELWTVICLWAEDYRRLSAVIQRNLKLLVRLRIIILFKLRVGLSSTFIFPIESIGKIADIQTN